MRPPRGGLRPLHNKRADVSKVALNVPAGGVVHAQDDVADQLLASGDFAEGPAPAGLLDALDDHHAKRFPDEAPPPDKPTPAKKAAVKK